MRIHAESRANKVKKRHEQTLILSSISTQVLSRLRKRGFSFPTFDVIVVAVVYFLQKTKTNTENKTKHGACKSPRKRSKIDY